MLPAIRLKPWAYPVFLTAFALLIGAFLYKTRGLSLPMTQYFVPATELCEYHHIQSDFFPVGYTAFLGLGLMLLHADRIYLLSLGIYVLLVLFCYLFLRMKGIVARDAALISTVVALFPSLSASIFNVSDINFTTMLLFAVLATTFGVVRRPQNWFFDCGLGVFLGCALLTRLNLVILLPIIWMLWKRQGVPLLLPRIGLQMLLAGGTYIAIAMAVHGRPFMPRYGAYNLYAGANPYTSEHMNNEEDSIWAALPAQGILVARGSPCVVDYKHCFPDIYDAKLDPIYRKAALDYIKEHPVQTAGRSVWRLWEFLKPDFLVYRPKSLGGVLKVISACVIPLWLLAVVFLPRSPGHTESMVVPWFVAAFTLPYVLIVSDPRHRIPIELVCLADLLAMVVVWWRGRAYQD